jgi:hypothetical protein
MSLRVNELNAGQSQAAVYKLFPGGWEAVLAACRAG